MKKPLETSAITALVVIAACFTPVSGIRAVQSDQGVTTVLSTGQWHFFDKARDKGASILRTFKPDGTFSSSNGAAGAWQITGDHLDISFPDNSRHRFFLPIDPNGTRGIGNRGEPETLATVALGAPAAEQKVAPATNSVEQANEVPGASGPNAPEGAPPASIHQTLLETLSQEAPNASAWVLAPLDEAVPDDIRQNLTMLREDLLDEAKANHKDALQSYAVGRELCDTLIAVLDERDATLERFGYSVKQADANTIVTSQSLEANRNHQMSWPQYRRERAQAAEIFREQMNHAAAQKELPKLDWDNRAALWRKTLDYLYAKYRQAMRDAS